MYWVLCMHRKCVLVKCEHEVVWIQKSLPALLIASRYIDYNRRDSIPIITNLHDTSDSTLTEIIDALPTGAQPSSSSKLSEAFGTREEVPAAGVLQLTSQYRTSIIIMSSPHFQIYVGHHGVVCPTPLGQNFTQGVHMASINVQVWVCGKFFCLPFTSTPLVDSSIELQV